MPDPLNVNNLSTATKCLSISIYMFYFSLLCYKYMCLFAYNCESSIVCVGFVEKEMIKVCEFGIAGSSLVDKRINISI